MTELTIKYKLYLKGNQLESEIKCDKMGLTVTTRKLLQLNLSDRMK